MPKIRKAKTVNRENRSPLMRFKLNQEVKAIEWSLSGSELETFRQMSPADKRDVVLAVSKRQADDAIEAEIIDYFRQLNAR